MKKLFVIVIFTFVVVQVFCQTDTIEKQPIVTGGSAFEFFSGYGIFTGTLHDNYTNSIPLGIAFDLLIEKYEIYLRCYAGFNRTKIDLDYSIGTYTKGEPTRVFLPEVSLGYVVFDRDRYKLSPYAGIGIVHISPPPNDIEKTPKLKEVSMTSFTCNFGVNFDLKFRKKEYFYNTKTSYGYMRSPKTSYAFIRIRYGFCIATKRKEGVLNNIHYITIGLGGHSRIKT